MQKKRTEVLLTSGVLFEETGDAELGLGAGDRAAF
jgi:hypothetical protein